MESGLRMGQSIKEKVVVSNANAFDTFLKMMDEKEFLKSYLDKFETYSVSLSCFQGFPGIEKGPGEQSGDNGQRNILFFRL